MCDVNVCMCVHKTAHSFLFPENRLCVDVLTVPGKKIWGNLNLWNKHTVELDWMLLISNIICQKAKLNMQVVNGGFLFVRPALCTSLYICNWWLYVPQQFYHSLSLLKTLNKVFLNVIVFCIFHWNQTWKCIHV